MPPPERKSFLLRIPPDLWQELERWAAADLRSVNGQIEFLLRQAVAKRKGEGGERPGPLPAGGKK
jgi:hypothetical protein